MLEFLARDQDKQVEQTIKSKNVVLYISLGMHLVWTTLVIFVFLNQDVHVHKRSLAEISANDTSKWWTFDEHTKTLLIQADVVKIGQPRLLSSNKNSFKSSGSSKLIIHGGVESASVQIANRLDDRSVNLGERGVNRGVNDAVRGVNDAVCINYVCVGAQGVNGATGDVGAQGDIGATGAKGDVGAKGATGGKGGKGDEGAKGDEGYTGEGIWWTYDNDLKQLNLLTDVVDTGTIIATEFNIKS